jgi:hypothetical protein
LGESLAGAGGDEPLHVLQFEASDRHGAEGVDGTEAREGD